MRGRTFAGAALASGAVLFAAACGTSGTGGISQGSDVGNGKTVFTQSCASCHTLADAGSTGKVGPNLDEAFFYDRKQGFAESTIEQVIRDQIDQAVPPMPQKLVAGKDADDVSAYIASVAGVPGKDGKIPAAPSAPSGERAQQPPAAGPSNSPLAAGKGVFQKAGCGGCHVLKDAGGAGAIGPNLDELKPDPESAERQVRNGGGGMPPFKGELSDQEIAAVAAYVADVAGK